MFFNTNHVRDLVDHASNGLTILMYHALLVTLYSQRAKRTAVLGEPADSASSLSDLDHLGRLLLSQDTLPILRP